MSRRTPPNQPVPPNPPDDNLDAWLQKQAAKLTNLEAKGNRLKFDFVQNARDKGELLLETQKAVSTIPGRFQVWVVNDTDMGYSTALLWIEFVVNWEDVQEYMANSNPLELTERKVRQIIRDARQKRGEGKPGSGRKKAGDANTPPTGNAGDKAAAEPEDTHIADAEDQNHVPEIADSRQAEEAGQPGNHDAADRGEEVPNKKKSERVAATAVAAEVKDGGMTEAPPANCKVIVTVFSENDQAVVLEALSNYSPISKGVGGSRHLHIVAAHFQARQYGTLLQQLGKAIAQCQGKTPPNVRINGDVPPSVPPR